jgi:hypothetical protein
MATPPMPPSLEQLPNRPFSFYPAIANIEHNEWMFRKTTWSEILVVNLKTGAEIWIPRRYIGELSRTDEPVLIVGLTRELEYQGGMICPHQRRVVQMPAVAGATSESESHSESASVLGIRLKSDPDRRMFRLVGIALAAAVVLGLLLVNLARVGSLRQGVVYTAKDQSFLDLTPRDDYLAVVSKLGRPSLDRSAEIGTIQYRGLGYPERRYTVVLMGSELNAARYIGIMDENWRPVYATGDTTMSLLRSLRKF